MKVTDPIADLLTRLRNASRSRKTMVHIPYSKMKDSICAVLKKGGFILDYSVAGEGVTKEVIVELLEDRSDLHLKRISKPGQRIYIKSTEVPRVLNGLGIAILSTPKGVMTGSQAKKARIGGEYLCEVY
jgi:small subunit ribosomal protein S8